MQGRPQTNLRPLCFFKCHALTETGLCSRLKGHSVTALNVKQPPKDFGSVRHWRFVLSSLFPPSFSNKSWEIVYVWSSDFWRGRPIGSLCQCLNVSVLSRLGMKITHALTQSG